MRDYATRVGKQTALSLLLLCSSLVPSDASAEGSRALLPSGLRLRSPTWLRFDAERAGTLLIGAGVADNHAACKAACTNPSAPACQPCGLTFDISDAAGNPITQLKVGFGEPGTLAPAIDGSVMMQVAQFAQLPVSAGTYWIKITRNDGEEDIAPWELGIVDSDATVHNSGDVGRVSSSLWYLRRLVPQAAMAPWTVYPQWRDGTNALNWEARLAGMRAARFVLGVNGTGFANADLRGASVLTLPSSPCPAGYITIDDKNCLAELAGSTEGYGIFLKRPLDLGQPPSAPTIEAQNLRASATGTCTNDRPEMALTFDAQFDAGLAVDYVITISNTREPTRPIVLRGPARNGANSVSWLREGAVTADQLEVRLWLVVQELHLLLGHVQEMALGARLARVGRSGLEPVRMRWDVAAVSAGNRIPQSVLHSPVTAGADCYYVDQQPEPIPPSGALCWEHSDLFGPFSLGEGRGVDIFDALGTRTPEVLPLPAIDVLDTDGDGLSDVEECKLGLELLDGDTDNDGLSDFTEVKNCQRGLLPELVVKPGIQGAYCSDPHNPDTDGDWLLDGQEDLDQDGTIIRSANPIDDETSPTVVNDRDGDGLHNYYEDRNRDGVLADPQPGVALETDPDRVDTDGDGLADSVEQGYGVPPSAAPYISNPRAIDTDGDGLSDAEEDANANGVTDGTETSPVAFDTDLGGQGDGLEQMLGLDPLNAADDMAVDATGGGCLGAVSGSTAPSAAFWLILALFGCFARRRKKP